MSLSLSPILLCGSVFRKWLKVAVSHLVTDGATYRANPVGTSKNRQNCEDQKCSEGPKMQNRPEQLQ